MKTRTQELKAEEYIDSIFKKIRETDGRIHAYVTVVEEMALKKARELDKKIRRGEKVGRLAGVAVAVKDNICISGVRTTCSSKMLENFTSPYDATVVERLNKEDAIIVGKTNMDEFAMGSSTEFSAFGVTRNPYDEDRVPGGSSGGSAAAVASKEATLALGSDTGGSVRCPAAFCSVVGLKPTYGLVSRFGLISYANSLEQIGPITKDIRDCALLLNCIAGHDVNDATSVEKLSEDYTKYLAEVDGIKVGIPKEFFGEGVQDVVAKQVWQALHKLEEANVICEEISWKDLDSALAAYYIIAMAEASSNLARFDGIRYGSGMISGARDWNTVFSKNRSLGFGFEVKRRIILGSYALSAGYYDEYYLKAQKIRTIVRKYLDEAFKRFDVLASPTMPVLPFKIGEKVGNPLEIYTCDILTVPANLAGVPAISIPCGFVEGLPVGLQFIAPHFREDQLFRIAHTFEGLQKSRVS